MKWKGIIMLFVLLSVLPSVRADEKDFENMVNDMMSDLKSEGATFVESAEIALSTPGAFGSTVFDAFRAGSCGDTWVLTSSGAIVATWFLPATYMAMIVMFGVGIIYMIGQLLGSPNLIAIAKEEAWQAIVTVVRVLFIAAMIVIGYPYQQALPTLFTRTAIR